MKNQQQDPLRNVAIQKMEKNNEQYSKKLKYYSQAQTAKASSNSNLTQSIQKEKLLINHDALKNIIFLYKNAEIEIDDDDTDDF